MMRIAFYNGRATGAKMVHKVILAVSDPFTHAELIFSDHLSYSSEYGIGPRFKKITYSHPDRWFIVDLPYITQEMERRIRYRAELRAALQRAGLMGYDTKAAIGCGIPGDHNTIWADFCSETIYLVVAPEVALPDLVTDMFPVRLLQMIEIISDVQKLTR